MTREDYVNALAEATRLRDSLNLHIAHLEKALEGMVEVAPAGAEFRPRSWRCGSCDGSGYVGGKAGVGAFCPCVMGRDLERVEKHAVKSLAGPLVDDE